jgi:hypothetical protein
MWVEPRSIHFQYFRMDCLMLLNDLHLQFRLLHLKRQTQKKWHLMSHHHPDQLEHTHQDVLQILMRYSVIFENITIGIDRGGSELLHSTKSAGRRCAVWCEWDVWCWEYMKVTRLEVSVYRLSSNAIDRAYIKVSSLVGGRSLCNWYCYTSIKADRQNCVFAAWREKSPLRFKCSSAIVSNQRCFMVYPFFWEPLACARKCHVNLTKYPSSAYLKLEHVSTSACV